MFLKWCCKGTGALSVSDRIKEKLEDVNYHYYVCDLCRE